MTSIFLISHGDMAPATQESAEMIMGDMEGVFPLTLQEGDSPEMLTQKIQTLLESEEVEEQVLILVDLPGATPFNIAARMANEDANIGVTSGLNLPMLVEVYIQRQGLSIGELEALAKETGQEGIRTFSDLKSR